MNLKSALKDNVKNIIAVSLIMIPVIVFGFLDMTAQMTISLFAGFASAVLLNIDRFKSFKAGQLEAKLRETNKIIDDASATIEQLRSVTEPLLNANLSLLIHDGVFDGMNVKDKEKTLLDLLKIKKEMGLDSEYNSELFDQAKKSIAGFYLNYLFSNLDMDHPFYKYTTTDYFLKTPSIEKIEKYFKDNPTEFTEDAKIILKDFKRIVNLHF